MLASGARFVRRWIRETPRPRRGTPGGKRVLGGAAPLRAGARADRGDDACARGRGAGRRPAGTGGPLAHGRTVLGRGGGRAGVARPTGHFGTPLALLVASGAS